MQTPVIHIKNMCCQRCIEAVEAELQGLDIRVKEVKLGEIIFHSSIPPLDLLNERLKKRGFEIISSPTHTLIEAVKLLVMEIIRNPDNSNQKIYLPEYLSEKLQKAYTQIHKIFVNETKLSIEKYFILQRIEKVKALIQENQLTFAEIAHVTGYKTQQHLSSQFKKITGKSMLAFKTAANNDRKNIDQL